MAITIDELEKCLSILFKEIRKNAGSEINLTTDYYWNIPEDEAYNMNSNPQELTIGQISEEIEIIKRLLDNPDSYISYDLRRIGIILMAMGHEYKLII